MKGIQVRASGLAAVLLSFAIAQAAPPPSSQVEIDNLLSTVAMSNCEFNRNGSWYDARSAAAHLKSKYHYLLARDLVQNAEDFIEKAATASSLSGRPYAIRCKGNEAVPTRQWLLSLLSRYRESHPVAAAPVS
jgi:Family of unknown function (DUF5329)